VADKHTKEEKKDAIIKKAINARVLLEFLYRGHRRRIEPYIYGVTKKGRVAIKGVQVAGTTKPGSKIPDWDIFYVKDIVHLHPTGANFYTNFKGYKPTDKKFKEVYIKVTLPLQNE